MPRIQIEIAKRERDGVADPLILEVNGEEFKCQTEMSEFVMLELASQAGADMDDPDTFIEAGAAFMNFLKGILDPADWRRFRNRAVKDKWGAEDLLPLVQQAVEYMTARPTRKPSDSGASASTTGTPSKEGSYLGEGGGIPPVEAERPRLVSRAV